MNFSYFSSVASNGEICRYSDFIRLINLPIVGKLIEEYRGGNPEAKKRLPAITFQSFFQPGTKRSNKNAQPSGLVMVDIDKCTKEQLQRIIDLVVPKPEVVNTTPIMLVHITPSGKGLRIVIKATRSGIFADCRSIADYQLAVAKMLNCEELLDSCTIDLARLSFVPRKEDVLYLNKRMFSEQAEVTQFEPSHPQARDNAPPSPDNSVFMQSDQTTYDGVPLKDIFLEYLMLTGGMPQQGGRNSRFYAAARDLRYICDFNPYVIAAHLPKVGLGSQEVLQLCTSAVQSTRSAVIPSEVVQSVAIVKSRQFEAENEESIKEGNYNERVNYAIQAAPVLVYELLKSTPTDFREATLLSLLPIIGTLSTGLRSRYLDGQLHSPSFFTTVTSPQATGKSFARRLVNLLLSSIAEEDAIAMQEEMQYKEELRRKRNAKEQPPQPRVKIRLVPASISIAKLLQRLDFAGGEHLFTFAEEMDTLIKSNKSGTWAEKNDLYRNGFDNGKYGQDYMSESSYSANVAVYYNLLVLGTPLQTNRFFNNIENGLVSRCCFAFIPDQFGAEMPVFKPLTENVKNRIASDIAKLRQAHGEVNLDFVNSAIKEWDNKQRRKAVEENNNARDTYRRRCAVMGFRAALALYPLYDIRNEKSRQKMCKLAVTIADITLENLMTFGAEKLNRSLQSNNFSPIQISDKSLNIFQSMPDKFSLKELEIALNQRGMNTRPRQLAYLWKKMNLIKSEKKGFYEKVK